MPSIRSLVDELVLLLHSGARQTARMRLGLACVLSLLLGLNVGVIVGGAWIAAYVVCEMLTQQLHDRLQRLADIVRLTAAPPAGAAEAV